MAIGLSLLIMARWPPYRARYGGQDPVSLQRAK